jgi:hypothetical protein
MFSIKMYRRDPWQKETESYQNYQATFQNLHAAQVYAEGLQQAISVSRINIINDKTGEIVQSMQWVQGKGWEERRGEEMKPVFWDDSCQLCGNLICIQTTDQTCHNA